MRCFFIPITFFLLIGFAPSVAGQFTLLNNDPDASFKQAKILYQQGQLSLAYPVFKQLYNLGIANGNMPVQLMLENKYYYIIAALDIDETGVDELAKSYIDAAESVAHAQMMAFHLGEYYYRKQTFSEALSAYEKTNIANLNNLQIANMKFHQGYAYFVSKKFEKALPLFNSIRQLPNHPNYKDANYYYGFLEFNNKKYGSAIESFLIAEKDPDYQMVVPFYLVELYYFTGEKEKALTYGEQAIQRTGQYYDLQLKQLVGHIFFEQRKFSKALPYLESFVGAKNKVRREDLYELSYCYYEAKKWTKAIEGFKQIGGANDSLEQNSMYLLADAYLKTGDLQNARNAFQFCAANNSNKVQKEVSAFHYAKLSYDLSYFDIAAKSFQQFLNAYPTSTYQLEARELLISTLANTNNYKDALSIYAQLGNTRSENALKLYPRLLYGRVVELINDQHITEAEQLLNQLMTVSYNANQLPLANFWKAELAYRSGKTDEAIAYSIDYLKSPIRNGEVNSSNARYNLAYCYLKKENYKAAKEQFELVNKNATTALNDVEKDAILRTADCWFMLKDYRSALPIYEQVIQKNWSNADYALYQKAIIKGAQNKSQEKLVLLNQLEAAYAKSAMLPQSYIEIANTHLANEDFEKALPPLYKVVNNNQAIALHPQAYQKLGIALFNLDKNDASLDQFKILVKQFPNSAESETAIEYIRNIFVEKQQPAAYIDFMNNNGKSVGIDEADSITYRSAMIRYEAKDNLGAESGFTEYVLKYPNGKYAVEANYFLAEVNIVQQKPQSALPFYTAVASKAPNKYAERSALQAARIYYFDLQDYTHAAQYFTLLKQNALQQENKLEAMRGLLRCNFKTQQWAEAAPNAAELLLQKGIASDDQLMAGFVIARNEQLANNYPTALVAYQLLLNKGKSAITAEVQYRIAELQFQLNKLAEAEKSCFEVIKKFTSYDIWVTKSYILVGDIYFKQADYFNAEATFKSVAENAIIPILKQEAADKLAETIKVKEKNNKVQ